MAIMCYIIYDMNESVFDFSISCMGRSRTKNTYCCLNSEAFADCTFDNASYLNINSRFKYIHVHGAISENTFELK